MNQRRNSSFFKRSLSLLLLLAGTVCASPAPAWNDFGHMTVAYLAYKKLKPETRSRVDQLLKLSPAYAAWSDQINKSAGDSERNAQIFMLAATWPDTIKGDHDYHVDGTQHGFRPDSPEAGQNIGYADHNLHKYWHFIDQPFTYDHSALPGDIQPNALTQLAVFRRTIAGDAADDLKSFDLVWILHIVGDLHQPLHCVTRVDHAHPDGDSGGNDVHITGAGDSKNLHGLWDWILGKGGPADVIAFADKLPDAPVKQANNVDANKWAVEGFKLARKNIYTGPIKKGVGPYEVDDNYREKAKALAQKQVELGGARLANLLNNELK